MQRLGLVASSISDFLCLSGPAAAELATYPLATRNRCYRPDCFCKADTALERIAVKCMEESVCPGIQGKARGAQYGRGGRGNEQPAVRPKQPDAAEHPTAIAPGCSALNHRFHAGAGQAPDPLA